MGEGGGEKRKEGFSPSVLSLFSLPSCPFSPETPDTQARIELLEYLTGLNLNGSFWVCQFQSSVKFFFNSQFDSLLLGFGIFSILAILFFTL